MREIKERNLKVIEEAELIANLYGKAKAEKRKRKMLKEKEAGRTHHLPFSFNLHKNSSDDDEEG